MLTVDKIGDVVHRARAIEGIHRNQILEGRGLQLAQILLHTRRLELERTRRATFAIELICRRVVDINSVDINVYALRSLYVSHRILYDREGFQAQEVHLDKSRILNHGTLILRHEHLLARLLVVSRRYRHPIGDVITADNRTAGVHTRTTHVTLQHLGVFNRVVQDGVLRILGSLQLRHGSNRVL